MGNLLKIANLLSHKEYRNGCFLGEKLSVTRAAIWKYVQKLEEYGVSVTSVKGKGYILEEPLEALAKNKILAHKRHKADKVIVLEKVTSTNEYLKNIAKQNKSQITSCIAEYQSNGRGRLNRSWHSPFGKNIHLSLLYPLQSDISSLSGISLIVGLAACHAIEKSCSISKQLWVKWPNDIMADDKKLGGILIELQAESNGFCTLIIGIGINVNMSSARVDAPWNSIFNITDCIQDRNKIVAELIDSTIKYLDNFQKLGLDNFMDEWQQRDYLSNKKISTTQVGKNFTGVYAGINSQGQFILKLKDGSSKVFSAGDTTINKSG